MRRVTNCELYKAIGPYSYGCFANFLFFSSGITGIDPKTNTLVNASLKKEITQLMENIDKLLRTVNLKFSDVIKVTVYSTNISLYKEFNKIYRGYFESSNYPARTFVEVSDLPGKARFEVDLICTAGEQDERN